MGVLNINTMQGLNALRNLISSGEVSPDDVDRMTLTGALVSNPMPQQRKPSPLAQAPAAGGEAPRMMRAIGMGEGKVTDMGEEPARAYPIDYTQAPLEMPGVGRVMKTRDPRVGIGTDADGNQVKVYLGYDAAASRKGTAENLALDKMRAEIEQARAATARSMQDSYQLTPSGDMILNTRTGQLAATPVNASNEDRHRREAAYNAGLKDIAKDDAQVQQASALEDALKQWGELQPRVQTGRIMGMLPAIGNADRQRLQQLENYLAMNNFKPGQGSMSNMERSLIKGAGPSVMNDAETNMDIVKVGLGAAQTLKDKANFKEAWLQAKGSLLGSDSAWQKYLDQNPRYVRDEQSGRIVDNPNRMDWQTAFAGGGGGQSRMPAVGEKRGGWTYTGGDPASPGSWRRQ